jgi:hypothetical protein
VVIFNQTSKSLHIDWSSESTGRDLDVVLFLLAGRDRFAPTERLFGNEGGVS